MKSSHTIDTLTCEQLAALSEAAARHQGPQARGLETVPPLLGRYEVREAIGVGGMGAVYKAWDRRLEAHVAVKIARADGAPNNLRLLREARAAAAVHHENVVGIRDVGEAEDGTPFFVMDFLEGEPLSSVLVERGRLPLSFARPLLDQIAHGLQAAHEAGIVHRDLKPSNVFVNERETGVRCTLIDFGLARAFDVEEESRSLTKDGQLVGTPRYMSPEQITGDHPIGPASDIYAWGCVAYHVLSGTAPFGGTLHQLLHKHVHETVSPLDGVPRSVDALVRRCLRKDPQQRPASVLEVRTGLAMAELRHAQPKRAPWLTLGGVALALPLGWALGRAQPVATPLTPSLAQVVMVRIPEAEHHSAPAVPPGPGGDLAAVNARAIAKPEPAAPTGTPETKSPETKSSGGEKPKAAKPSAPPKRSRAEILRELDGLE